MMPLIGYFLGSQFSHLITRVDHWIAFILLGVVGANMIRESFGEEEEVDASFQASSMLPLAVATSIDALAVGITLAFLEVNVVFAIDVYKRQHVCGQCVSGFGRLGGRSEFCEQI